MWMMGCNDGDSFNGRRLRPLIPKPTSNTTHPCLSRIHGSGPFPLNTHLASIMEQSKKEFSAQTPVGSSRWNPTPEQLRVLEDLYRRGTRTPTAEQIQHITAQLRRFGKIEGKNVFYWFQNHKARERQKRRRREEQHGYDIESLEKKESGSSVSGFEVEQKRNWAPLKNCNIIVEESVSMQRTAVAESRAERWIQLEEGELLQQRPSSEESKGSEESHATWQMMHLSCSSTPTHIKNTMTSATTEPMIDQPKLIFSTPNKETLQENLGSYQNNEECGDSNTLQLFPLFPLRSDDAKKETKLSFQFFEFLPMKK